VFYEDRDSRADEWDLEQLARAIYRSTSVILCLTPDYLRDRRRQYEMALAHDAMVHRYGVSAKDHVIVIVLRESGEVASHVPDILRGHFNRKDVIVWNTDTEQQQRHCRSALQRRLLSNVAIMSARDKRLCHSGYITYFTTCNFNCLVFIWIFSQTGHN
jgi:hypothetical protein